MSETILCIGGVADGERLKSDPDYVRSKKVTRFRCRPKNYFCDFPLEIETATIETVYRREQIRGEAEIIDVWVESGMSMDDAFSRLIQFYSPIK